MRQIRHYDIHIITKRPLLRKAILKLIANYFKLSYKLLQYSFIKNQYNYIFQTFLQYLSWNNTGISK